MMRGLLADPVVLILVVGTVGLVICARRLRTGLVIVSGALFLLFALSTTFVSSSLLEIAQWPYVPLENHRLHEGHPTAIVVLSAGRNRYAPEYGGQTVDRLTLERLRYAARVFRATGLPVLVSGGLSPEESIPMADLMKRVMEEDFRVPVRWTEDESESTLENARFSARLLKNDGIEAIILVTSAFHMRRAAEAFAREGLTVVRAGTDFTSDGPLAWAFLVPTSKNLKDSAFALHEIIGAVAYRMFFY